MSIKEDFKKFTLPNHFSRINTTHVPEIHIGLDGEGRKAIDLREKFTYKKVKNTNAIEVNQYKLPEYNTIRFSLKNENSADLFYMFCEDLIAETSNIKELDTAYKVIVNRYYQWKDFFVTNKKEYLNESEIMGLLGELLFIKDKLSAKIGLVEAIKSWSGQELTHKDFSYNNEWFEVKSISSGKDSVKISSLEQLESSNDGELVVYTLEKMSSNYQGLTINKVFEEILQALSDINDKDDFREKVSLQGYEYSDYYNDFVYEIRNYVEYIVNDNFPKLTHKNVPKSVVKANYELSLQRIDSFKKA